MIFVDTGAWYASVVPDDKNHRTAIEWLAKSNVRLCTTDYMVDETLTLLRSRGQAKTAITLGVALFGRRLADLILTGNDDIKAAWDIFQRFGDKRWSFTDCTCKAVMQRLGITKAISFDRHFRQFGDIEIVP